MTVLSSPGAAALAVATASGSVAGLPAIRAIAVAAAWDACRLGLGGGAAARGAVQVCRVTASVAELSRPRRARIRGA